MRHPGLSLCVLAAARNLGKEIIFAFILIRGPSTSCALEGAGTVGADRASDFAAFRTSRFLCSVP